MAARLWHLATAPGAEVNLSCVCPSRTPGTVPRSRHRRVSRARRRGFGCWWWTTTMTLPIPWPYCWRPGDNRSPRFMTVPRRVSVAQKLLPDIVLMDIGMPRMSGYAVAQALRSTLGLDPRFWRRSRVGVRTRTRNARRRLDSNITSSSPSVRKPCARSCSTWRRKELASVAELSKGARAQALAPAPPELRLNYLPTRERSLSSWLARCARSGSVSILFELPRCGSD